MPLILPANTLSAAGHDVANSCRFNDDDGDNLSKAYGGASDTNFTWSAWIKRCSPGGGTEAVFSHWNGSSDANRFVIYFEGDSLVAYHNNSGGSAADMYVKTTAVYRDPSAWYHFVVGVDTTQGTAGNRIKIYTNGVQQTSLSQTTYPDQNYAVFTFTDGGTTYIGRNPSSDSAPTKFFDGYMAEVFLIDGTTYAASDFGEFNEDSPTIWQPKDVTGLTFGTNGTYLDFEDSGNLGDDESGNENDLTENNIVAADQCTDTPTNNFSTINPLYISGTGGQLTLSDGNTTYIPASSGHCYSRSSMGFSSGNWYLEAKITEVSAGESAGIGVVDTELANTSDPQAATVQGGFQVQFSSSNTNLNENASGGSQSSITTSFASGDIAQMAVDADNGKIWIGHNGTWWNDDNASTTLDASNHDMTYTAGPIMQFYFQAYLSSSNYDTTNVNFGCPAFAISSGNNDANGYGNFEFAVPSGFYSLCTKNLAEYG